MNRLDKHVGMIQNKLTLERFLATLGVAVAVFCGVVLIAVLVDRFFWVHLPKALIWFWSAAGAAFLAALVIAIVRRPTQHEVAVFIDDKLGLNEKFSTAIYARAAGSSADPFLAAAVKDAERTADNVSLHRRFPIEFPKSGLMAAGMAIVVVLVSYFLPRLDLFEYHAKQAALVKKAATERQEAMHAGEQTLARISSQTAASMKDMPKVELAKKQDELQRLMNDPKADPQTIKDIALKAQEEAEQASKMEEVKQNQAYAEAQAQEAVFSALNPAADDKGPVATASRDIADGKFAEAVQAMKDLPAKFNDLTPEQQARQTQQMQHLAQQLNKLASDPAAMNNLKQKLQQQGITQPQVQQAAQLAQQAAQGNQQAAQQLQQQMTQQLNGGKGPTQQQQAAIQQAVQQMQSVANAQQQAQQMTGAAQQMVQGMQAAQAPRQGGTQGGQQTASAQAGNPQQGGAKQGGQQMSGQQGAGQQAAAQPGGNQPGQQPGGQQPGSQQANGQQPGGQQPGGQQPGGQQPGQQAGAAQANGSQPGGQQPGGQQSGQPGAGQQANGQQPGGQQGDGQGPGQGQQQMKNGADQMAQALGQMDAVQKDRDQVAAAQKAAQQPDDDGNSTGGGKNNGKQPGQGGQGPGQLGQGNGQKNQGMGGMAGQGQGGVGQKELTQYSVKQELDPSQNISGGKVLAKAFVKAPKLTGQATIEMTAAAKAAAKDATDEVNEESIPKDAQKVVKDYFDNSGN